MRPSPAASGSSGPAPDITVTISASCTTPWDGIRRAPARFACHPTGEGVGERGSAAAAEALCRDGRIRAVARGKGAKARAAGGGAIVQRPL